MNRLFLNIQQYAINPMRHLYDADGKFVSRLKGEEHFRGLLYGPACHVQAYLTIVFAAADIPTNLCVIKIEVDSQLRTIAKYPPLLCAVPIDASVAVQLPSKSLAAARVLQGNESLTPVNPSALQVRHELVDHKRILNTAVRLSAMIRAAQSSLDHHKHCRKWQETESNRQPLLCRHGDFQSFTHKVVHVNLIS